MAYTPLNPYISLVELCDELKRPLPANESNLSPAKREALEDELKRAIDRASRWVDDYTRRDYYFHDYSVVPLVLDERSPWVFGEEIMLPWPVLDLDRIDHGTTTLTGGTDYTSGISGSDSGTIYSHIGAWHITRPDGLLTIFGQFGYRQESAPGVYSSAVVPAGLPAKVTEATRKVAAAFSGHWRKEIIDPEGGAHQVAMNEIPSEVYKLLGKRMPILV